MLVPDGYRLCGASRASSTALGLALFPGATGVTHVATTHATSLAPSDATPSKPVAVRGYWIGVWRVEISVLMLLRVLLVRGKGKL